MDNIAIGIDLGGTYVRVGVVDQEGGLITIHQAPIEPEKGSKAGLILICSMVENVISNFRDSNILGIGIGATGPIDRSQGTIQNPYTLSTWDNVPIVAYLTENFRVPVTLENDADASALGEYWVGAGQESNRLVSLTFGTGVGAAIIIDGQVYRGMGGSHPEIGHHIIDPSGPSCYCGAQGCWESLVSGPAIARNVQQDTTRLSSSLIFSLAGNDISNVNAFKVAEAALNGDGYAKFIIEKVADYIGIGVINVISFFVPDTIVLSGGVMKSIDLLMPAIQKAIISHNVMIPSTQVRVLPAKLGYHSGLIGAAYPIFKQINFKD